ncbi:MAG: hypothetical protein G8237_09800 [Magnetococcales bacterium]|nr:hypothetical protein [Magnetococcales bacterium]NGZ06637.1 hypothetical protein [Magnetococcales bacterium]
MDLKLFGADLTHLDHHSLEKITHIAAQARRSLLIGIASIRNTEETTHPESAALETSHMVAQLGRLTLMWDEIHHRASRLLTDEWSQPEEEEWSTGSHKPQSITLH